MRIPPVRIRGVKKNLPSYRILKPKTAPKIDLSGEENGYFKDYISKITIQYQSGFFE